MERERHQRVIDIPPPPDPPYDIETMEPIRVPAPSWPDDAAAEADERDWQAPELPLGDGRILVLDADPGPGAD